MKNLIATEVDNFQVAADLEQNAFTVSVHRRTGELSLHWSMNVS